jgi:transcriptional regulator with XRE-family HTH domain
MREVGAHWRIICRFGLRLRNCELNQLADAAHIGRATIRRFEAGRRTPIPNNLAAIRRALEDAGVEFIPAKNGKGVGVRLREES